MSSVGLGQRGSTIGDGADEAVGEAEGAQVADGLADGDVDGVQAAMRSAGAIKAGTSRRLGEVRSPFIGSPWVDRPTPRNGQPSIFWWGMRRYGWGAVWWEMRREGPDADRATATSMQ